MTPTRTHSISAACAVALFLVGCGGGSAESDDDVSAASVQQAGEAPTEAIAVTLARAELPEITTQETTTCRNRSIGAVQLDNLFVPDGASCQLTGTRFKGSIVVGTRSRLEASRVRVNGNIQGEGSTLVKVVNNSIVGGSVQIKQGAVATVNGTRITGDLQFDSQSQAVRANYNRINGNLQAFSNSGGVTLNKNVIDGNLQCKSNYPRPTGSGNVATSKEDQCARL